MKITAVEAVCLAIPMKPLDPPSSWTGSTRKQIVVRVKTDAGLTGIGEAFAYGAPLAVCNVIEESLAPLISPRDMEGRSQEREARMAVAGRFSILDRT